MRTGGKTFDFSKNTSFLPAVKGRTCLWALQQCVATAEHPVGAMWVLKHPQIISPPIQPPCRRHLAQGTTEPHHHHRMLPGNGQWEKKTSTPWAGPLGGGVHGTRIFGSGWPLSTFLCTQPSPQPLPWLITSLTFICGDSRLLLFHLPVKGLLPPPWENSLSVDQRQEKHNHTCSQRSPLARNPL